MQLSIDFEALARSSDPDTSHEAAAKVDGSALCAIVYRTLVERGPLTTHEIANLAGLAVVTVSPRIKPMRLAGRVVATGARRDGRSVWAAVQ